MRLNGYIYNEKEVLEMLDIHAFREFGNDLSDVVLRFWNNESACGFAILKNGEKRYIFVNF